MVTLEEFKKLDLRVATVRSVKDHPNADKLYLLTVDLGDETREIVAGIKPHYRAEELTGKSVIVVCNLEPALIRGVESRGMLLAAKDDRVLGILTLDRDIRPGSRVS
ncbi:MAG: methionine--tRNA ligase subunit beta [Candidatus Omnitrophica bacterium]|nr:methionine--tRNA ligase subunit beta [Candidatus Omnitrophota bacterium]